jgi:C-terminal processing protease CtpA/Prc
LLAGPEPTVKLGVRRANGKEEELELARDVDTVSVGPAPPLSNVFGKLPSGLGYIDLTALQAAGVDRAFDELIDTPGLILDLRGSAAPIFTQVAARLTSKPVAAARTRQRVWHGPNPHAVTEDVVVQYAYPAGKPAYSGPVAILIDAHAFSAAEHTALFLSAAAKVTFVGTPTSGTNGNITRLFLPGAIQANFAAMEISHPDGAPLQRVGILPDVWIEPTVKGLQQGRDEVLERAVELLTRK